MNNVYVRSIRRECKLPDCYPEIAESHITRFDSSNFDAAMDFADSTYAAHKESTLECCGNKSPEWHIDAFFGEEETKVAQTVYKDGSRYPREKLLVNSRRVFPSPNGRCGWEVITMKEFASDVLYDAIAYARALSEKMQLTPGTISCVTPDGHTKFVLFKDDLVVQMMRDGNYVGQTLFSVQEDKGKKTGLIKTTAEDVDTPVAASTNAGPSIWQVLGVIGLAGAVGYGAWKITGMMVAEDSGYRGERT